ncbi:hypothetical protein EPYR_03456 [Erwinia pyrifoliae DSM 12163]|nr:hypothetical protein EPYR_03456 [Erwinia pyrifoliae DSM 12163]
MEEEKQGQEDKHHQTYQQLVELAERHGFAGQPTIGLHHRPGGKQQQDNGQGAKNQRIELRGRQAAAGAGTPAGELGCVHRHDGSSPRYWPLTAAERDEGWARDGSR